jgi:hypothetical protein
VVRSPFLTRRLREWSLFRAITGQEPWRPDTLLASSDWLQLKTAATSSTQALAILAEHGRTRPIRNTARVTLNRNSPR